MTDTTINWRRKILSFGGLFCIVRNLVINGGYSRERKKIRKRAMTLTFTRFAFTYRFSFAGERAGETRAEIT